MKLWQRIFLVSLAVVLVATGSTAVAVLSGYFSSTVGREEENAVRLHCYLSSAMAGSVLWQRISDGVPRLPPERVDEILEQRFEWQDGFSLVYLVDESGKTRGMDAPEAPDPDLWERLQEIDSCITVIRKSGSAAFLTVGSRMNVEGRTFFLFTETDISEVYRQYRDETVRGLVMAILFAVGIALLLLLLCYFLLRPLSRVNDALGTVAGGDYKRRLSEKGSPEIAELSRNVNRMASAIEEQTDRLQATADSRKRFADSMAHEMKTPLTSILCMADLLRIKKEVPEEERREYAGVIVDEANRMKALSSKLLTLASADGAALDRRPIPVSELVNEVAATMTPILARKNIRLETAGEDGTVLADRSLFETLLINLIDNAAKASEPGQKVMVVHTVRENTLLLAVADEGRGMDEETLRHATEPFYMADKARSRKEGGAGLGLFLCAEVAKLHDATLRIESEPGKGTTVFLEMPAEKKEAEL